MIRGLSGTAIAEDESGIERGDDDDGQLQGEVKDLEHGVKQGGKVWFFLFFCTKCQRSIFVRAQMLVWDTRKGSTKWSSFCYLCG